MTDLVVSEGYAAVGYDYINVDDCWLEKNRGPNNELVADRRRFPSGMRSLSDYVSSCASTLIDFRAQTIRSPH
jgi:alpha-N-acetylgalactosaminidase